MNMLSNYSEGNSAMFDQSYHNYRQFGINRMSCVGPIGLIALPGSQSFAQKVNRHLYDRRLQYLEQGPMDIDDEPGFLRDTYMIRSSAVRFSSGEGKATIQDSVRGHDVYIFCDVLNPSITFKMFGKDVPMGPDDHFQDLIRMLLATCDKCTRVNVIMPFLYQSRQDMRISRESLDCAYMLKELDALNVNSIISFDPHDARVENALPRKSIENFPATYQMIKTLLATYDDLLFGSDKQVMVISPDEMGLKRAMYYANVLGLPLGTFYRQRDFSNGIPADDNGINRGEDTFDQNAQYEFLGESPEGRDVLIVDDMIVSGATVIETARKLKAQNARRIIALATYAPLVNGVSALQEAVDAGYIDHVFSTNLIYNSEELLNSPWFVPVDMTQTVALIIDAMNHNSSVSPILDQTEKIKRLIRHYQNTQTLT